MINNIARIIALVLSCSSGAISVFGLATIFSGAYYPTIAVASILETAKVISAAWLQKHWHDVSKKVRGYLCFAVFVLMVITSIGVYGFFARAHIDTQISISNGETSKLPLIEGNIKYIKEKINDLDIQLKTLDGTLNAITDKSKTSREATLSLEQQKRNKKNRDELRKEKDVLQKELIEKETEKVVLSNNIRKNEAELGPIKYIANIFYGEANNLQLEFAVRWLIIIIVSVFDPFAIILIIATSSVANMKRKFKFKINI